jgi:hypothetical protein
MYRGTPWVRAMPGWMVLRVTLCLVLLPLFLPARGLAQVPDSIPATLLRRLAETAESERSSTPIWIVVDQNFPHRVYGAFEDRAAALEEVEKSSDIAVNNRLPRLRVFGPFITPLDFPEVPGIDPPLPPLPPGTPIREAFFGCVHERFSTELKPGPYCPDLLNVPAPLDSLRTVVLQLTFTNGRTVGIDINPRTSDAVFFKLSAWDKFLSPYYIRLYGPAYTHFLRNQMLRAARTPSVTGRMGGP